MENFVIDCGAHRTRYGDTNKNTPFDIMTSFESHNGRVDPFDFEKIQHFWMDAFSKEKYNLDEYSVMYSLKEGTSRKQKEHILQIYFELFECPSFYMANSSRLIAYDSGIVDGYVFNLGHSESSLTSVKSGITEEVDLVILECCGVTVEKTIVNSLPNYSRLICNKHSNDIYKLKDMLYLSSDYLEDRKVFEKDPGSFGKSLVLGDPRWNSFVNLSSERFEVAETMFSGIPDIVKGYHAENRVSGDVVVAGGLSNLTGFVDRLKNSVKEDRLNVIHRDRPDLAAWRGGSLLMGTTFYENGALRKSDYEEFGVELVCGMF